MKLAMMQSASGILNLTHTSRADHTPCEASSAREQQPSERDAVRQAMRRMAAIWELSRERRTGGVRSRQRGGSVGASRCDHALKTRSRYAVRLPRLFRPAVPHST